MKLPILGTLLFAAASTLAGPVPTPEQLAWQQMELTMFCHFGVNTFTDREWGDGKEDPKIFNPSDLDCRQWAQAAKAGGFKLVILTAKHHDGFCLWPSKVTEHSVKNSPWKDGKGDVVKEFTEACRAEGLKVGLYLSPWDRNAPVYGTDAYSDFFCNQLTELLSNYGVIDEVWFDGACGEGPNGKKQVYDWTRTYALIRRLQPKALIAIMGPDIRWVGNESGVARVGESSVRKANEHQQDRAVDGMAWHPAECDVSIRPGWFYHASQDSKVKSIEHLMDIYFKSVGRNSVMLLNVPPDRKGRFADPDVARLKEFGAAVNGLYAKKAGEGRWDGGTNGRSDPGQSSIGPIVQPSNSFNLINLQEDITRGERVQAYRVEGQFGGAWRTLARGTVIGQRNLHKIGAVQPEQVRLVVEKSDGPARVAFALYDAPVVGEWATGSLTAHKPAQASNVHPGGTDFGADKAVDDDANTRWATSDDTRACWLEVDLLKEERISKVSISELQPRIQKFQVEHRNAADQPWQVAHAGEAAGTGFKASFPPVQARFVRLNILEASNAPTLWEFGLYPK
jgi:alpha-L-fucosidase